MNDFYMFGNGVYGFQNVIDPVLEFELKKCKTQEERDRVVNTYQTTMFFCFVGAIVIGAMLCGVISLFAK